MPRTGNFFEPIFTCSVLILSTRPRIKVLPKDATRREGLVVVNNDNSSSKNDASLEPLCLAVSDNLYFGNAGSFQNKLFHLVEKVQRRYHST